MTDTDDTLERPVRTQADLEAVWRALMEPLGFSRGALWFMLIGSDDQILPVMNQLKDDGDPPSPQQLLGLAGVLADLVAEYAPGGRFAFLRARPGRGGPDHADRGFAADLLDACRTVGVPTDVVHLATDDRLVPLPFDELARSA